MKLTKALKKQLRRTSQADASRKEREAVIDLLVMTMYADRFIDSAENDAIERVTSEISDNSALPLAQYLGTSIAKVRRVLGDEERQRTLLQDISERLHTDRMRTLAYEASRAVARADDQMADDEEQFLDRVRSMFEVQP